MGGRLIEVKMMVKLVYVSFNSIQYLFAGSNGLITERMLTQVVLVDESKRSWSATLHNTTTKTLLTCWCKLITYNDVKVGDACMFELVKAGEVPVFNFHSMLDLSPFF